MREKKNLYFIVAIRGQGDSGVAELIYRSGDGARILLSEVYVDFAGRLANASLGSTGRGTKIRRRRS